MGGRGAELEVRAWQARAVSLLVTWAEAAGSAGLAHGARARAAALAEGASDRCLADDCLGYGLLSALGAAPGGSDAQLAQLQGLQRAQQGFFAAFAAAAAEMAAEWGAPPPLEKPAAGPSGALPLASPAPAPTALEGALDRVGGGGSRRLKRAWRLRRVVSWRRFSAPRRPRRQQASQGGRGRPGHTRRA